MRGLRYLCRIAAAGVVALVLGAAAPAAAQVSYTGSLHFVRAGTPETGDADAVYVFNSVDVERGRLRISATLPVLMLRTTLPGTDVASPWESGIGDPTIRADVAVTPRRDTPFGLRIGGAVKLPIADVDRGLGSGEVDVSMGVTVTGIRGRDSVMVDVSYWMFGDPPDLPLRNVPSFYAGYGRVLDRGYRWSLLGSISSSPSAITGLTASTQAGVTLLRTFGARGSLGLNVSLGFTDTSPDVVVGTMWRYEF